MLIEERIEFEGDPAAVWEKVSDIQRIPEFWHGTRSLEVIGREGGKVKARARFAFGGSGEEEISAEETTMTLTLNYVSGPFTGVQTVRVVGRTLEARWSISFNGVYRIASSWIGGHFRSGTVHALERLCGKDAKAGQKAVTHV